MEKIIFIIVFICMAVLFSCTQEQSIDPGSPRETGALKISINTGKVGKLNKVMKANQIEMTKLVIVLGAVGQNEIRDTIQLTGGSQERTERITYYNMASWNGDQIINWFLMAQTYDQNGNIIHWGDTMFQIPANDTIEVPLTLTARYSHLVANFFPIRDSITHCILNIDNGDTVLDSSFQKQLYLGDTVSLSYDYLTASQAGVSHHVILDVLGEFSGEVRLMYTGDTNIIVRSGIDENYQITLKYAGPDRGLGFIGAATMVVSLGKLGDATVNGVMSDNGVYKTITYRGNANDSGTVPVPQKSSSGWMVTIKGNEGSLVKNGCTFSGWNTAKNGLGTNYQPGETITIGNSDLILYANWTVNDIDGNVYHMVTIGNQTWMVENLNTTRFNDGIDIPLVEDSSLWNDLTTPGFCWYNNDSLTYMETFGALYNWYAVNTGKLAPEGWHVATDAEWSALIAYLGGGSVAAGKLKETGTAHWNFTDSSVTNESGFTAVPGGSRSSNGFAIFSGINFYSYWWASTGNGAPGSWRYNIHANNALERINYYYSSGYGFSVRCVKN
jgi:uncharacterized protein (TIGR02145 family)/uncharacterized repeat protein (TIGR02543 family)